MFAIVLAAALLGGRRRQRVRAADRLRHRGERVRADRPAVRHRDERARRPDALARAGDRRRCSSSRCRTGCPPPGSTGWSLIVLGAMLAVLVVVAPRASTRGCGPAVAGRSARSSPSRSSPCSCVRRARRAARLGCSPGLASLAVASAALAAGLGRGAPARLQRAAPPAVPSRPRPPPAGGRDRRGRVARHRRRRDARRVPGRGRHFGGVHALDDVTLDDPARARSSAWSARTAPARPPWSTCCPARSGRRRGTILVAGRDIAGLRAAPDRPRRRGPHLPDPAAVRVDDGAGQRGDGLHVRPRVRRSLRRPAARPREHLGLVGAGPAWPTPYPAALNLHQRQLLEMARALAAEPQVLLLDEALAGLNPAEIDNAVEVIRRIHASGITIVIVEHLLRVREPAGHPDRRARPGQRAGRRRAGRR